MKSDKLLMLLIARIIQWNSKVQLPWRKAQERRRLAKVFYLYLMIKEKGPLERRWWVRPSFPVQRRFTMGNSDNLAMEMRHEDKDLYTNYFRMDPQTFDELLALIKSRITKQHTVRVPIPAKTRLELCLRYLASGDSMTSTGYAFRIGKNTASTIITETCKAYGKC